jgi:putative multicomponent Na+:H+ antiporter subunit B
MTDSYIYVIVALLPLTSLMLVFQVNPYHALVMRAIVGAVAALVDVVLGAPDVALTEALVGTMLSIALYVIAVRSSLVMKLGILKDREQLTPPTPLAKRGENREQGITLPHSPPLEGRNWEQETESYFQEIIARLRKEVNQYHLRLELVEYPDLHSLEQGLKAKEVHAICHQLQPLKSTPEPIYQATIRVHRLFELLEKKLTSLGIITNYLNPTDEVNVTQTKSELLRANSL